DGKKTFENGIDELRVVVKQREAREEVHQTIARHAATASFKCGEIVGTEFHFELLEFVTRDASLLYLADHGIKSSQSGFAGVFRLVQNFCDHLRWAVVAEEIVNTAVDFHGDLLFENQ